ncbi:hypothetical protein Clacol_000543 [Clathrus columnatus]|uniref:Uncharacterized protein n=1 Tax=Clathrus columnatus TaxID=1419009 RepID=A0AAV4ZYP0_9AGAM|nr:hypothetical protein Clacol_000543 [Clathrus columnatus]
MSSWKETPLSPVASEGFSTKKSKPLPTPLRQNISGVNPSILIGKVLQKIVRSSRHPMIKFHFSDSSVYQVHVEGYHPNPAFQGVPKELEMNSCLDEMLTLCQSKNAKPLDLTVTNCGFIRLTDKAFEKKNRQEREVRWDQNHLGLAFKFEGRPTWHCVWAAVVDHDDNIEVFRSYEDVYLEHVAYPNLPSPIDLKSPTRSRFPKRRT